MTTTEQKPTQTVDKSGVVLLMIDSLVDSFALLPPIKVDGLANEVLGLRQILSLIGQQVAQVIMDTSILGRFFEDLSKLLFRFVVFVSGGVNSIKCQADGVN